MYNRYNKLVRDNIPRIIEESGKKPDVQVLTEQEYIKALDKKLSEEVAEYQTSKSIEEIADILEVLDAICVARGYGIEQVLKIKVDKLKARGAFDDKLFLIGFKE